MKKKLIIARVLRGSVIALIVLAFATMSFLTAPTHTVHDVTVVDDAEVVDSEVLKDELSQLKTYKDTRIVVLARPGRYNDNIDYKTVEWAKKHPDLRLIEGDSWAPGTLIIAVSVEHNDGYGRGQVQTYYGDDIRIANQEERHDLQEKGYKYFQKGDWTQGIVEIADANAQHMARPFFRNSFLATGVPIGVCLLIIASHTFVEMNVRRFIGDSEHFDLVTHGVNERVANTDFVEDGDMGRMVHNATKKFLGDYSYSEELRDRIEETPALALSILNIGLRRDMREFSGRTDALESASDLVNRAATLYSHDTDKWQIAWIHEVDDTREHLQSVLNDATLREEADSEMYSTLCHHAEQWLQELDQIESDALEDDGTNTSANLEKIAKIRIDLSTSMKDIHNDVLSRAGEKESYIRQATNTALQKAREWPESLTGYFDANSFYAPAALGIGYKHGTEMYLDAKAREYARRHPDELALPGYDRD